jgi:phenylalanyl-tRNA synthetase beta chain
VDLVAVKIEDAELCPRYTARIIKGVKIGPSPDWLRSTLEKVGIRSISNVVDVTNYVMLETGQPLHAFDFQVVAQASSLCVGKETHRQDACATIVIRRADDKEKFKTLDNQERTLTSEMLLIADERKGIALAGVMGGANTEINDSTVDVLIESAYFSPVNIRRTSKLLGLRSESSYRFERGADMGICDWASQRAAQLILETAGGQLAEGVVDVCPKPAEPRQITLHFSKSKDLLGVGISHSDQVSFLTKLGLAVTEQSPGVCTFKIPSWRVDLKREVDLIEEVERLYGVEKIPATPPRGAVGANAFDSVYDQIAEARRILSGLGLNEAQGQTLISKSEVRNAKDEAIVALANPLSSDMDVLRPSLLPGLIHAVRHNVSRKNYDVALFEIGRVFKVAQASPPAASDMKDSQAGSLRYVEERRVAIAITGQRSPNFWGGEERDAKFGAFDLKGVLEEFLEQFGVRGVMFTRRTESSAMFLESATIALGGKLPLGEMGQLSPALAKQYDLRGAVFLAELNLDQLLARRNSAKSFKPLPQFPSIRRDMAMLVPGATTHEAVVLTVKKTRPANLETMELFDIFRGKNVPEGQKSLAYTFTYRSPEKTLTDAEVNAAHKKIVEALKQNLGATVRE